MIKKEGGNAGSFAAALNLTKKRKFLGDYSIKQEGNSSGVQGDASLFKKPRLEDIVKGYRKPRRGAQDVLKDVLSNVQKGDRPVAASFMREFTSEHLSTLVIAQSSSLKKVVQELIAIASIPKYDDLCRNALRTMLVIVQEANSHDIFTGCIRELLENDSLFTRYSLDKCILNLGEAAIQGGVSILDISPLFRQMMYRSMFASDDPHRRVASLQYYVTYILHDKSDPPNLVAIQKLEDELCFMTADMDDRVRVAAVSGLLQLGQNDKLLTTKAYEVVKKMCNDTKIDVRTESLRIMQIFAEKFPEEIVTSGRVNLSLSDDAFSAVCDAMNDPQVSVRAVAACLLGQFTRVSDTFLFQTLDKKLMRSMKTDKGEAIVRNKKSMFSMTKDKAPADGHQRKWRWGGKGRDQKMKTDSEWSTGKKLNEIAPGELKETNEEDGESIVSHGACGAFVTALEDEFMAVRKPAVYSLGRLAADRPAFAASALDHLADMFNDEIAEVRLDSIHALTPLVVHGQLQKEQLDTILKCLDDAMPETRQALRTLLVKGDFADVECVRVSVRALLLCMKRFPSDLPMVYKCMSELGTRHAVMVQAMVAELLNLHPVFEPQEFHINDEEYVAKALLILAAASEHPPILSLLPPFVVRHYRYLRASVPALVPVIESVDGLARREAEQRLVALRKEWSGERNEILQSTFSRLVAVEGEVDMMVRSTLRQLIIDDVTAISAYNSALAGGARLLCSLADICTSLDSVNHMIIMLRDAKTADMQIEKELCNVMAVQSQFIGVDPQLLGFLISCAFHLMVLKVVIRVQHSHSEGVVLKGAEELLRVLKEMEDLYVSLNATQTKESVELFQKIALLLTTEVAVGKVKLNTIGHLNHLMTQSLPRLPSSLGDGKEVKVKWAEIKEPSGEGQEKPIRFIAGLPTAITLHADVHNVNEVDAERLRILIRYPDLTTSIFTPRKGHVTRDESGVYRLRTEVLLSARLGWADAAQVVLTVVLLAEGDGSNTVIPYSHVPLFECPAKGTPAQVKVKILPMVGRC